MKLLYRIILRLSLALLLVMAIWASFFYYTMVDEINDETDDSLEDHTSYIVTQILSGKITPSHAIPDEKDPAVGLGSNNSFSVMEVSPSYAAEHSHIRYFDSDIFIPEKNENEPARLLVTIFKAANGKYYEIRVATPTFEKEDLFLQVLGWTVLLYFSLLVVILIITTFILYRSFLPLYELLSWLDKYKPGGKRSDSPNSTKVPNNTNVLEFRRLNLAVQKTIDRSEEVFERQKEFIGNVSHELQTPLAVIGNHADWLLANTQVSEEQATELFKMKQTLRQITRTNQSLLLLTKIENNQFTESSTLTLPPIIEEAVETYKEIYSNKEISLSITVRDNITFSMNDSLARILTSNLIKNAYLYTPNGGSIDILLDKRCVIIKNQGNEPIDEEGLFNRYHKRSGSSLNLSNGSNGLGLAIIKAICTHYNLEVKYNFQDGYHNFSVFFPDSL